MKPERSNVIHVNFGEPPRHETRKLAMAEWMIKLALYIAIFITVIAAIK